MSQAGLDLANLKRGLLQLPLELRSLLVSGPLTGLTADQAFALRPGVTRMQSLWCEVLDSYGGDEAPEESRAIARVLCEIQAELANLFGPEVVQA